MSFDERVLSIVRREFASLVQPFIMDDGQRLSLTDAQFDSLIALAGSGSLIAGLMSSASKMKRMENKCRDMTLRGCLL